MRDHPQTPVTYDLRMTRVITYVGGFNLYHGAKELIKSNKQELSWKWLDLVALSHKLWPKGELIRVKYYTARVSAPETDPTLGQRQQVYLRALASDPMIEIILGQFQTQKKRMPLVDRPGMLRRNLIRVLGLRLTLHPDGNVSVPVWRIEEKATDVNLGVHLIADAFRDKFDVALVISNDSDLCEPIRMAVQELGKRVVVVNPRGHTESAVALRKVASEVRKIRVSALTSCQLPVSITDSRGIITRPDGW